jgi:PadR family transcriptional regulator PadR
MAMLDRELKKGSAELLILSLVEYRPRHGYEIGKLIEARSDGRIRFKIASLYPLLYRLEERGWIQGRWIERAGTRRRRFYRLTAAGRTTLRAQRTTWEGFVSAIRQITEREHA